jgi:hypothetical protein
MEGVTDMRKQNDRRWMNEKGFMRLTTLWAVTAIVLCAVAGKVNAQTKGSEIVPYDDALKGQSAVSVFVEIDGEDQFDYRSVVEAQLREAGIKVLPQTDPPTFPLLRLIISTFDSRLSGTMNEPLGTPLSLYVVRLQYRQLLPVPGQPHRSLRVTTWESGPVYGAKGPILVMRDHFVSEAKAVMSQFIEDYYKANPQKQAEHVKLVKATTPRGFTEEQHRELIARLYDFLGQKVNVNWTSYSQGDREMQLLVMQIHDVLQGALWSQSGVALPLPQGVSGIMVEVNPNAGRASERAAAALVEGLRAAGLDTTGPQPLSPEEMRSLSGWDSKTIFITVGKRPL